MSPREQRLGMAHGHFTERRADATSTMHLGREATGEVRPDISVIIATRDRAETLQRTLQEDLARQATEGEFSYEVLVVDNGSTDRTRDVVESARHQYPVTLRYLYEARLGKPHALNTGMEHAWGAVFAVTDDDALPDPRWLLGLWRCLQQERADAVGGRVLPLWEAQRPAWMSDEFVWRVGCLGLLDHGAARRRVEQGDCRWVGSNLAIRREAVARVGGFDVRLIRSQDTEFYNRCVRAGLRVCYEPSALVRHRLGAERMALDYYRRWNHRTGYYNAYSVPWRKYHLLTVVPWQWYYSVARLAWIWLSNRVAGGPWPERFDSELKLRGHWSLWLHRLALWPRWLLTLLTGRRFVQ